MNDTPAEILRSGLVNEMLSMLALGIDNPLKFDFIDPPDEMTMARALHILKNLNAINNDCKITAIGRKMAKFPVNPRMAKSLVIAKEYNCIYEMIVIAAMMEVEDRLYVKPWTIEQKQESKQRKKGFYHSSGDHLTLLNIFNAWSAVKRNGDLNRFCDQNYLKRQQMERANGIKKQIENVYINVMKEELSENNNNNNYDKKNIIFKVNQIRDPKYYENIIKALLSGHFMNVAVKGFGDNYWRFRLLSLDASEKAVDIIDKAKPHQNSMFHKNNAMNWIIFNDVSISHVTQLKILTAIKPRWLNEINSNGYYSGLQMDKTPISRILRQRQQAH